MGALVVADPENEFDVVCSGTLISETVFLTAAHCVDWMPAVGIQPNEVWVTFDSSFGENPTLYPAIYHLNPNFGRNMSDPHDIAVLVLDEPILDITPAQLPPPGLLDQMKATHALRDQTFVTVGYGMVREEKTRGPNNLFWDPQRRYVEQSFLTLTKSWLTLSMNPATGDGGTCFGDSGGPHFLGDTNVVVSLTATGDAVCRATDKTYRLDTESARNYLGQFVILPE